MEIQNNVISVIAEKLALLDFKFEKPPVVIGGMAMEYYGLRKSGADIDLVITDSDYQRLATVYPENRKDLYGDLGVVISIFEIWRSIALLDYTFFDRGSLDFGTLKMVSIEQLLFSRVSAMEVKKYLDDLTLIKEYYYKHYRNVSFSDEADRHIASYDKNKGVVVGGNYID